jgi:hypothetical protein
MRTTVVIPNYNGIEYLENCLNSLFAGTVVPAVIVVDNGSTDGSRELVCGKFPAVQLIAMEKNTGFSCAVNAGIKAAQTEYVFLLNNDTVVDKSCVEELEAAMENNNNCFSIAAKMINMKFPEILDDAGDFFCALGWAFARGKDKAVSSCNRQDRIFSACAGAAIYRKDLLLQVGLFDEAHFAYLEDVDIGYRAGLMGYQNRFAPKALVYHAGSGVSGSRHNPFKVDLTARNSVYLIYKNMPFLQIIWNLPFLLLGHLVKWLYFTKKGMGFVYLKGLWKGIRLCCSKEGRKKKLPFLWKRLGRYLLIQWELYAGLVRRII